MAKGAGLKYDKERKEIICNALESGHTNKEAANMAGICLATLFNWKNPEHKDFKLDFLEALKEARVKRLETLGDLAERALEIKVKGTEYTETTEEFDKSGILKAKKTVTKRVLPSDTSTIFALTNLKPEDYKHKHHYDHTTKDKEINLAELTNDQLKDRTKMALQIEGETK